MFHVGKESGLTSFMCLMSTACPTLARGPMSRIFMRIIGFVHLNYIFNLQALNLAALIDHNSLREEIYNAFLLNTLWTLFFQIRTELAEAPFKTKVKSVQHHACLSVKC